MNALFGKLSLGETYKQNQETSVVHKDSGCNQSIQEESVQTVQRGSALENVYIAVMGLTGVGKSTFISQLVGSNVAIGHNLESCMCVRSPFISPRIMLRAWRNHIWMPII